MSEYINAFPGYRYVPKGEIDGNRHNMYRGVDVSFGGYVYSNPGLHYNVGLLDSASHHPTSAICMNYFGEYTKNFKDLLDARIFIKHRDFESAKKLMNGKLEPYLNDESQADALAQALKISINAVYGQTAATYENPFRDSRNINNIVALRGALFMKLLQDEVTEKGYTVVSIRTDSIKIANVDQYIIDFVSDFSKPYGYTFEHEATYEKMCLVDKTNYVAKYDSGGIRNKGGKHAGEWTATGATFQHPYIFKTLFSHEPIVFGDLCETKEVKDSAIYLDMNEDLQDPTKLETELEKLSKKLPFDHPSLIELRSQIAERHNYQFVGRIGSFCPIKPGFNGGVLVRTKGDKYDAVNGTKGYRWLEAELVKKLGKEGDIDMSYFGALVDDAVDQISNFGDAEAFISDDAPESDPSVLPWCDKENCNSCADRKECHDLAASFVTNI